MPPPAAALTSQTEPPTRDAPPPREAPRGTGRPQAGESAKSPHPAVRRGILTQAMELDVIPRLLLARQHKPPAAPAAITLAQVIELTDLTLAPDEAGVRTFIAALQAQGVPAETLYLDLLTPSARRLGVFWAEDVCDFTQVTAGMGRLHEALRTLGPAFLASASLASASRAPASLNNARAEAPPAGRILLAPLPGEQHTFGLSMVADFFRRAGWTVWAGPVASRQALAGMLRDQWVDVLGFTLACNEQMDAVRAEIAAARLASRNPAMAVMVGGPPFLTNPGFAASVGADGTASDGAHAVREADALLRRAAERK